MIRLLTALSLCLLCCHLAAQTLTVGTLNVVSALTVVTTNAAPEEPPAGGIVWPTNDVISWTPGTYVGVPGGIDQYAARTVYTNMTEIDNTGATDVSAAIQAVISSCPSNQVVALPAGTFRVDLPLYIEATDDGVTLRGAGMADTVLQSYNASYGILVGQGHTFNWPSSGNYITAGIAQGSTNVTIQDTTEFAVGRMIHFVFADATNEPVVNLENNTGNRIQKVACTAKDSTTLTFWPPLHADYNTSTNARAFVAQFQTDLVGVEDLTVVCTNTTTQVGVKFLQTLGSWAKNVRVFKPVNYGIFIEDSLNCELTRTVIDSQQGEGSNGGGVLMNTSSSCLVVNSIVQSFFPTVEINLGSSGNVFAYNDIWNSEVFDAEGAALNANHSAHTSFNLFEGNVSVNLQSDGYTGSSSRCMVLRNWFHGYNPAGVYGWVISLNRFTRYYGLYGNVFGCPSVPNAGYSFGNPNMGNSDYTGTASLINGDPWADWADYVAGDYTNSIYGFQELDLDVTNTVVLKHNYMFGTGIPANESIGTNTLTNSLIYTSAPSWWSASVTNWPPFNASSVSTSIHPTNTSYIPAQYARRNGFVWPAEVGP